jgi:glutamine synthetase
VVGRDGSVELVVATYSLQVLNQLDPGVRRDQAGNSMHLSLWRDEEPAFAGHGDARDALRCHAIGGILRHLPGIVLYERPP